MRVVIIFFLLSVLGATAAEKKAELLSVYKIWDQAQHNAFTDLIRYDDKWLCAFREGKGHVSDDGMIRIIASKDAVNWDSWAHLQMVGVDLRDPKICITPEGKLMLTTAGAYRDQKPVLHESFSWMTRDGNNWEGPFRIGEKNMWLWRVTWQKGTAYSVGYETDGEKFVRLYQSKDGKNFQPLVHKLFADGYPNETGFEFLPDDTALCLLRRDGGKASGQLGTAKAPYTDWKWKDLGVKIGGPTLLRLPEGKMVAGVRLYDGKVRTALVEIDANAGKLIELLALPSAGDSSYPGLVWHEGKLFMSYYSSHEGKTAIFLATVKL